MKQKLNLMIALSTLFAMFLGCEIRSKPQKWAKAKPLSERLDYPSALQNDEKFIYFVTGGTVASKNEGTNNVLKIPVGGGAPIVLFKGGEIIPDGQASAMDEKFVYFSANGLRKVSKEGGEAILLTKAFMASEIVIDNENLYWMPFVGEGMSPAPIYSISKNGGETKTLTDARRSANGLCLDDKFVYWIQTDGIYKTPKQGGTAEKIYTTGEGKIASDLKIDVGNFFFKQGEDLYKLEKSGGEAIQIAKNVSKFWLDENSVILERFGYTSGTALYKVGKNGEGETELDKDGHLTDITISKNKIYLSDIVNIYELDK